MMIAATALVVAISGGLTAAIEEWSFDPLGIKCNIDDQAKSITVSVVQADGLGAKAGLKVGDVITKVNGTKAESNSQFNDVMKPGDTVKLTIKRGDAEQEIAITVPGGPATPAGTPEDQAKEMLVKAGFTKDQADVMTKLFVLKPKEAAANPKEAAARQAFIDAMVKAGMPKPQAEALANIFKFSETAPAETKPENKPPVENKPPAEVKPGNPPATLQQAMTDALQRGVPQDALIALITKGKVSGWDDAKIVAEMAKMTPQSKASDYQEPKKPVDIPPAVQAAIKQVIEKTGTPEQLIKGTVEDMLRAGRSEADCLKYLQGLMPPEKPATPEEKP
jgi:hypothetical protein